MGRPKRRRGDAAKNQLLLNGLRDVSSKILAKLREVEPQQNKDLKELTMEILRGVPRINLVAAVPRTRRRAIVTASP
jgi:hypothetical protein